MATNSLLLKYCIKDSLETFDPYDIWKIKLGEITKRFYNFNKFLGIIPAIILTCFDFFINNKLRLFYKKQEYPVVRAFAAMSLLNQYKCEINENLLLNIEKHLDWLKNNYSKGYSGYCWGINFIHVVSNKVNYPKDQPFSTITPYVLEAFLNYKEITNDNCYDDVIHKIFLFFENDIKIIEETEDYLITSYGTFKDRIVINAISYTLYSYSLFLNIYKDKDGYIKNKIIKLYNYIRENQKENGSWLYSPEGDSFIDCFHSCFILKNLIKASAFIDLKEVDVVIEKGYGYIEENFYNIKYGLYKRFTKSNKPSIIKFDLYDNAEMLNLLLLLNKYDLALELKNNIEKVFIKGEDIYSVIDLFGNKKNKNTLRWAVMPYLYSISKM